MLDINKIRSNPEEVKKALLKRMDNVCFEQFLKWDADARKLLQKIEGLRARRNNLSDSIPALKKAKQDVQAEKVMQDVRDVNAQIAKLNQKYTKLDKNITDVLLGLPNIPDDDVAAGGKEANKVIKTFGTKPVFNFKLKNHEQMVNELDLVDFERGVKLSGSGSWIYKGMGARLEWAIINYFIDSHIAAGDGWEFMLVPHMLKYECGLTAGQFPKFFEDVYWIDSKMGDESGKFLLPTAEAALVSVHMNETIPADELPKKYFGYTPCFRREAGSTRVEERGTVRGHQFNKVELVQLTTEENSSKAFNEMVTKAEKIVQGLGLHYQVSALAAGDCGAAMCKTHDIEVWIPSMNIYKEVSSVSNGRDYQARRGNIKYKVGSEKAKYVHLLNASALATSRVMPAILEQFQQADGSVLVPKVLQKYLGVDKLIPKK
ncbi:MAG: serine--tRNA ligase [Firmicutes bacterium]|nr:serine--tRNA ligase [Bacillota bacterium]